MTFGESIKTCYRKYANFKGRASRAEYWWYVLFVILVSIGISIVGGGGRGGILNSLWSLANLLPLLAAGVRRMQDIGKPGWYIIIPIYNIILAVQEGDKGPNAHGADPENMRPSFDFERQDLNA